MKKTRTPDAQEPPYGPPPVSDATEQPPEPDDYWIALLGALRPKVKVADFADSESVRPAITRHRISRR